jgi:hypothetical protein
MLGDAAFRFCAVGVENPVGDPTIGVQEAYEHEVIVCLHVLPVSVSVMPFPCEESIAFVNTVY